MNIKIVKDEMTNKEKKEFERDCFYMANLGSEVQRVFSWKEKGDKKAMENTYQRAILIINRIKNFDNKSATAEMNILKKSLEKFVFENKKYVLNRNQMYSYFNPFALRAMKNMLNTRCSTIL